MAGGVVVAGDGGGAVRVIFEWGLGRALVQVRCRSQMFSFCFF